MKTADLQALAKGLAPALKQYVAAEIAKLRAELLANAGPSLKFWGSWRDDVGYAAGAVVQRGGNLYIAAAPAPVGVMPASEDEGDERGPWKLCVRRGRDGKPGSVPPDFARRLAALEQRR